MSDPDAEDFEKGNSVRLLYKIIGYVAIWIVALLLTAPGLWALAWMFPLGLVAVIDRHTANDGGWGLLIACYAVLSRPRLFLFPLEDHDANGNSLRRPRGPADRQRRRLPRDDSPALNTVGEAPSV